MQSGLSGKANTQNFNGVGADGHQLLLQLRQKELRVRRRALGVQRLGWPPVAEPAVRVLHQRQSDHHRHQPSLQPHLRLPAGFHHHDPSHQLLLRRSRRRSLRQCRLRHPCRAVAALYGMSGHLAAWERSCALWRPPPCRRSCSG